MLPMFTILTCDPSIYSCALPILYCNYITTLRFFFMRSTIDYLSNISDSEVQCCCGDN